MCVLHPSELANVTKSHSQAAITCFTRHTSSALFLSYLILSSLATGFQPSMLFALPVLTALSPSGGTQAKGHNSVLKVSLFSTNAICAQALIT